MEVHFTPEQEAQLAHIATKEGTDPERLVKDAALRLLEEDARFRAAVRKGITQADRGEFIEEEAMEARLEQMLLKPISQAARAINAARKTRAGGRPRCACGAMTAKRAKARSHKCAARPA